MQLERKKIIGIIALLVVAGLLAVAMYFMFFKSKKNSGYYIVDGEAVPVGQLPNINDGLPPGVAIDPNTGLPYLIDNPDQVDKVLTNLETKSQANEVKPDTIAHGSKTETKRVIRGDIRALSADLSGEGRFYNADDGKFYKLNAEGKPVLLSDKVFRGVKTVAWNKRGENAILEFPDGSNIFYDFKNNRQVTLPAQMTDFDFSFDGGQIAFEWENTYDNSDNWLGVASPDGSSLKFVEPIGDAEKRARIQVQNSPDGRYIALYTKGTALDRQQIIPVGKFGENLKSFDVYGRGFESQWSPDGKTMLYSVHSDATDRKPQLWVAKVEGDSIGDFNQPIGVQTWADKCAFSSSGSDLYCSVPDKLPEGIGLFPDLNNQYPEKFYHIDLKTGKKSLLADPVGVRQFYNASKIILSKDESKLFFVDSQTNDIFSIQLK